MKIEITPIVVLPDTSPLIHLAAGGQLSLLSSFGHIVVMDIVAYEATHDTGRPWAKEVAEWLQAGQIAGSNHSVEIVTTESGEAYRLARQTDPTFRMRNAGERAIRDWLVDDLPDLGGPALVVYEEKKVPRLIQREALANTVIVATTRAMLDFAQERGLIQSAEDVWSRIMEQAPGANPEAKVHLVLPTRTP